MVPGLDGSDQTEQARHGHKHANPLPDLIAPSRKPERAIRASQNERPPNDKSYDGIAGHVPLPRVMRARANTPPDLPYRFPPGQILPSCQLALADRHAVSPARSPAVSPAACLLLPLASCEGEPSATLAPDAKDID